MVGSVAAVGIALGPAVGSILGSAKAAKRRKQEAEILAAAERYESEATRNDLDAAFQAAKDQERVARERSVLEEQAEDEATRQDQLVADAGLLDVNIQQVDPQERRKRREAFYKEAP